MRFSISTRTYYIYTLAALVGLTVIVMTGAAVRLTGSGLGCPDWPRCHGQMIAPLELHALIEYGNRVASGLVGLIALTAFVVSWLRSPRSWQLIGLSALLPLGVLAQAVLGGFTVRHHLAPGYVMAHFILSMLILIAATNLVFRAHPRANLRRRNPDRLSVWATRGVAAMGGIAIFAGTTATAAGPHAGATGTGEIVHRLNFRGVDTLEWIVAQHAHLALLFAGCVLLVRILLWRRQAPRQAQKVYTKLLLLIALQVVIGITQYRLKLPAELVWVHVSIAAILWLSLLLGAVTTNTVTALTTQQTLRQRSPGNLYS